MAHASAVVHGRVRIAKGLAKKRITIPQVYDRYVAFENVAGTDSSGSAAAELQRVVVYIEGAGPAAPPIQVNLDQKKRRFEPEVLAMPVGSTVSFLNSDPIFHNVFSLSKTRPFELGNYRIGESRQVQFNQPGIVAVLCHLHPNMAAAIVVTPNAWYASPREDGTFDLNDLPPGEYTLVAWHKSAGAFRRIIQITGDEPVSIDIEIPLRLE